MSVPVMNAFFSLLTIVALGGVVAALVALAGGDRATALRAVITGSSDVAAAAVTLTAMLGSLYYSEIAGFTPCQLCWFQRIFAYPLAVIFVVALLRRWWRRDDDTRSSAVWAHILPLAAIGLGVSTWHVAIQRFPSLDAGACDATVPCTALYVDQFGVFSIPLMAGTAFAFVCTWGAVTLLTRGVAPAHPPATSSARRTE